MNLKFTNCNYCNGLDLDTALLVEELITRDDYTLINYRNLIKNI